MLTDFNNMNVNIDATGAANAKMLKCLRTFCLSSPSWIKNETKPKAAGAFSKKILLFQTALDNLEFFLLYAT